MQVWQVIEALSSLPAGATVNVGVSASMNVECDVVDRDDMSVSIRSESDVEVAMTNGDLEMLSDLSDNSG